MTAKSLWEKRVSINILQGGIATTIVLGLLAVVVLTGAKAGAADTPPERCRPISCINAPLRSDHFAIRTLGCREQVGEKCEGSTEYFDRFVIENKTARKRTDINIENADLHLRDNNLGTVGHLAFSGELDAADTERNAEIRAPDGIKHGSKDPNNVSNSLIIRMRGEAQRIFSIADLVSGDTVLSWDSKESAILRLPTVEPRVEVPGGGVILTSPSGLRYKIKVDDQGAISTEFIPRKPVDK